MFKTTKHVQNHKHSTNHSDHKEALEIPYKTKRMGGARRTGPGKAIITTETATAGVLHKVCLAKVTRSRKLGTNNGYSSNKIKTITAFPAHYTDQQSQHPLRAVK